MGPTMTDTPSRIPWPPLLLVGFGGLAWVLGRVVPLPWPGLDDFPARVIGWAILAAGVVLMLWAIVAFQRARANILPHRAATTLITSGPFAIWRNPIYMADVLLLAGLAQPTLNVWFLLAAPLFAVAVYALAILPEEAHLERRFGEEYRRYKAQSRRWF